MQVKSKNLMIKISELDQIKMMFREWKYQIYHTKMKNQLVCSLIKNYQK